MVAGLRPAEREVARDLARVELVRVALSGYYGFGNTGDEALLEGLVRGLVRHGHRPVVLSADAAGTRRALGADSRHRMLGLPSALLTSDALVSGGGGLLQDVSSRRSLDYYLSVIYFARRLRRRVIVYGQSIGPLSATGERAVARILRGLPVAVRDRASQALLASWGIPSVLVGDPALLLAPPQPEDRPGRDPEDAALVLIPRAGQHELNRALARLGTRSSGRGRGVEILCLHPSEDRVAAQRLMGELPEARVTEATDHRVALSRVASAAVVVSARLHGLIFAALCDVPAIGLVYDPKVAGFLAESGGMGFAPPIDVDLLAEAVEAAPRLASDRRSELLERARRGLEWLDRTLVAVPG